MGEKRAREVAVVILTRRAEVGDGPTGWHHTAGKVGEGRGGGGSTAVGRRGRPATARGRRARVAWCVRVHARHGRNGVTTADKWAPATAWGGTGREGADC
jgi:hypothetical protein